MDMLTHLLWWLFPNIYIYQIITLYNLNWHSVTCQLYLYKTRGKKDQNSLQKLFIDKIWISDAYMHIMTDFFNFKRQRTWIQGKT